VAGLYPDYVRLVIVHNNEDHMVAAVYQDKKWLILDNLTMMVLPDAEKRDCFGLHKRPSLFVGFLDRLRGSFSDV
jgi:predicted transglutaminase-like cysteine proteinase